MAAIPMTREGYNRLKKEIERLENEEMPIILEKIATARAEGDLSENAEYHGARESQSLLQAKIDQLKGRIGSAQIINPSDMPQDEIRFGATFEAKCLNGSKDLKYTLVGAGEDDVEAGRILVTSPLAQMFLGKKVGDKVGVKAKTGLKKYEVTSVSYDL